MTWARRILQTSSRFVSDLRGASAVEFAIVSVPFLMILCSIFEAAFLVFNQSNLEYATAEAARQLLTGAIQTNGQTTAQQLTTFKTSYLCPRLWGSFNCANVIVDIRSGDNFTSSYDTTNDFTTATSGPNAPTYSPSCPSSPSGSGCVLVVRVGYPYRLYFNALGGMGGGSKTIMSTAVFKSENF